MLELFILVSNYADEVWLLTRPQGFNPILTKTTRVAGFEKSLQRSP